MRSGRASRKRAAASPDVASPAEPATPATEPSVEADAAAQTEEMSTKKFRSAVDESMSHLMCAITYELPLDPVTAEDGHIYERAAIAEWLSREMKSTRTNEYMGARLLPALQVRAMIESMVKSDTLSGEKAAAWRARLEVEKELKRVRADAENGSVDAMLKLNTAYFYGSDLGCRMDKKEAFQWVERAAKLGSVDATAKLGHRYMCGTGVSKNVDLGLIFLTEAAARNSPQACFRLGEVLSTGKEDVHVDFQLARRWFEKALQLSEAGTRKLKDECKSKATAWLAAFSRKAPFYGPPWVHV